MSQPAEAKGLIGLLPLAVGLAVFGVAAFDPRNDAFPSGRLPVVAAGCVFFFAGTAVFINGLDGAYRKLLLRINGTLLLVAFATVPLFLLWAGRTDAPVVLWLSGLFCLGLVGAGVGATIREIRRLSNAAKLTQKGAGAEERPPD